MTAAGGEFPVDGRCPTCGRGVGVDDAPWAVRCVAQAKRTTQRCQAWAIRGTQLCRVHGGMAAQVRARGEVRLLEAVARQRHDAVSSEPFDPVEDMLEAAEDISEVARGLRQMVAAGGLSPGAALLALGEWQDRRVRADAAVIDKRLDERRVRLAEGRAELLAAGLRWLFAELGMADDPRLPTLVPFMLRSLGQGYVPGDAAGDRGR
jgi:hypothetical protein